MDKDILKGNWKELKGKLKTTWGKLTDDEIDQLNGTWEQLEGQLQKSYGYQKDQARKEIEAFLDRNGFEERTH